MQHSFTLLEKRVWIYEDHSYFDFSYLWWEAKITKYPSLLISILKNLSATAFLTNEVNYSCLVIHYFFIVFLAKLDSLIILMDTKILLSILCLSTYLANILIFTIHFCITRVDVCGVNWVQKLVSFLPEKQGYQDLFEQM